MIINHGVRGSVPNPSQKNMIFGGNTPCVEIKTNQYQLIFDCGTGFSKVDFSNNLQSIIFISHFHHDHIQGLAFNDYDTNISKKITLTSAHSNKTDTYNNLSS
jgi:phosphoribosyl 1,2-cyclic phosphodiesterase